MESGSIDSDELIRRDINKSFYGLDGKKDVERKHHDQKGQYNSTLGGLQ